MNMQAVKPKPSDDDAPSEAEKALQESQKKEGPALHLAGLQFFIADISRKTILWQESGSQSFNSEVKDLQEAHSAEALRLLTPEDRKTILRLIQGAIRDGRAGPYDVGGGVDHRIPGIPLMAHRYEMEGGRIMAICFPSLGEDSDNPGNIVLGLAPILQHFVASSNRVVLLVDNFGYVRFASAGFLQSFQIKDANMILGRNIAHIQKRLGRSIVSLALTSLARRQSATGRGKFLLASNDSVELNYEAMYFRFGGTVGGVLFSAGQASGEVDFAEVFDICGAPIIVVNTKNRMMVAANKAAHKAYHLTQEAIEQGPITETLLHPKSYATLLEAAQKRTDVPQSVVINSLNGQSKKKRLKATLIDQDRVPKLILEART